MNHRLEYFALLLLLFRCSSTEEPKIKRCVRGYELIFFYSPKNNQDAKQACRNYGNSRLVKVDNPNITTVIDSVISSRYNDTFYIDGQADNSRQFTWSDGSKVNLRSESGYQNWAYNQPNDVGRNEDCIIVGRESKQWKDSPCSESLNYICQKDQDPCIALNSTTQYIHRCIATGSIEPHVEWRRNGTVVSNTSDQTIYQTKDPGISTLYYENATIGDVGEYLCAAWVDIREQFSAPERIKVNGTPSIINIESFNCNSSLLITWRPSLGALGFPHRIIVLSNELVANLFITPTVDTEYFTEITELQTTTKYNVQVTACSKRDKCSDNYTVHRVATTNGMIKSVINARIEQFGGSNTCIVSWEWPYITLEDNLVQFKIIILSGSTATSSNEDIRFVYITASNYSFEPQPGETYNVEIQSIASVGSCKTVHAIGSCIGKDANIQSSSTTDMFTDAIIQSSSTINMLSIILPVAGGVSLFWIVVLVVVLLVHKRKNTTTRNTTPNLTSEVNNRIDEKVHTEPEYLNVHKYEAVQDVQNTTSQSNVDVVYNNINPTSGLASAVYEYDN